MNDTFDLWAVQRGAIVAPAGCGKTHLIAQSLTQYSGTRPVLILTHTNAGVAALRSRLNTFGVNPSSYRLATIDGWAMRLISMFPLRSAHDPAILQLQNPRKDYPEIRNAALRLLASGAIDDVLLASFGFVVVDEYQDCSIVQHGIVWHLARSVSTCVLGDPLQAIFDFAGALANWNDQVCKHFPIVRELNIPWRWKIVGEEEFGAWLLDVRAKLLSNDAVDLRTAPRNVVWLQLHGSDDHEIRLKAARVKAPIPDGKVLIIAESTSPATQQRIASQTPGAVTVESVDLRDLIAFARQFDPNDNNSLDVLVRFSEQVMTNVGGNELLRRIECLTNGTARKSASPVEAAALQFKSAPSIEKALILLAAIGQAGGVRQHRPAVLNAAIRAMRQAQAAPEMSLQECAAYVREQSRALGRGLPTRAVGSTLLLKGLEADVSVVLNTDGLNRQNLYVAMTRGSRVLVLCSRDQIIRPH